MGPRETKGSERARERESRPGDGEGMGESEREIVRYQTQRAPLAGRDAKKRMESLTPIPTLHGFLRPVFNPGPPSPVLPTPPQTPTFPIATDELRIGGDTPIEPSTVTDKPRTSRRASDYHRQTAGKPAKPQTATKKPVMPPDSPRAACSAPIGHRLAPEMPAEPLWASTNRGQASVGPNAY